MHPMRTALVPALLLAFGLAMPLPALAQTSASEEHDDDADHDHHVSEAHGIRVVHAWVRATTEDSALIFGEISNTGDAPVTLLGAEAPFAAAATLVGFQLVGGEETYQPLPQLPIAPGTEVDMAPHALAVRLVGVDRPLVQGEVVEMELQFDVGHVDIDVDVEASDAEHHSHAGHQH